MGGGVIPTEGEAVEPGSQEDKERLRGPGYGLAAIPG